MNIELSQNRTYEKYSDKELKIVTVIPEVIQEEIVSMDNAKQSIKELEELIAAKTAYRDDKEVELAYYAEREIASLDSELDSLEEKLALLNSQVVEAGKLNIEIKELALDVIGEVVLSDIVKNELQNTKS